MKKWILFPCLLLIVLLQYYVIGNSIYKQESTLRYGEEIKFRTRIFDPYDPFRGRYVQLRFELNQISLEGVNIEPSLKLEKARKEAYLILEKDAEGFARVASIQKEKPKEGLYVKSVIHWGYIYRKKSSSPGRSEIDKVYIKLPFDRYYMNEKVAPEAEALYNRANRRTSDQEEWKSGNYAGVRIYKGTAVLESLYLSGKPIEKLLKESE